MDVHQLSLVEQLNVLDVISAACLCFYLKICVVGILFYELNTCAQWVVDRAMVWTS